MSKNTQEVVEPMAKIVLSGASGTLGRALRERLNARLVPTLDLVRNSNPGPGQVAWNPAANPSMADASSLEGCSAAIHLSGANLAARRWTEAYKRELVASRVDSTRALAELLAGVSRSEEHTSERQSHGN